MNQRDDSGVGPHEEWPRLFAESLSERAGCALELGPEETRATLAMAREVAHRTERRFAPLSSYLAGKFVAERLRAGLSADEAIQEARNLARSLLREMSAESRKPGP